MPISAPPEMYAQKAMAGVSYQQNQYPMNNAYSNPYQAYGTATPPVATNPYPAPPAAANRAFGGGTYDPEEEARIAEWSSAYTAKDDGKKASGNANTVALGTRPTAAASGETGTMADSAAGTSNGTDPTKQKTVVREGGGKTWEDASLLEWDPLHPRLFIGNLAGEVTDDSLLKAFSKYPSVVKARVVRDKRTTKSKSFGFVSFSNTDDYFRAAKDMNGKYIGSHPVLIKKATSEVKATTKRDDKHGKYGRNNKKGGGGNAGAAGAGGAFGNNGIQKPSRKNNKNGGPRMLG
ncbi:RNA-binding domain-containing protein [Pleomassaria siparia CBS 279.74]|uniref:RNA-binding domain-containing protein n=1 Tax=Pleomassaria siparia CBS 279.74 TaxID=1314801 RepID=A0A6G1KF53_9PLEO|nr:RNA-binding domain-containing protein [Pleomassaria siparia CBS 279.74]